MRRKKKQKKMTFLVLKSYDGGRTWELEQRYGDFAAAAKAADGLRSQHPMIRFRLDVEAPSRRTGSRRRKSSLARK